MSVTKEIGKVSITPKGEWSALEQYQHLDLVKCNGGSYIAIKDNINVAPSEFSTDTWLQIAEKGATGENISLSFNKYIFYDMPTIQGDSYISQTDYVGLQSFCYNSKKDTLLIGFKKTDQSTQQTSLIVEVDKNFNVINRNAKENFLHCNDITYNPVTDKYYIVSGDQKPYIYQINPNTLELEETYNIVSEVQYGLNQLSYKEDDNTYIGVEHKSDNMYILDENFHKIKQIFTFYKDSNIKQQYTGVSSTDFQGSCIYNNLFVSLYWIYRGGSEKSYGRLIFYSLSDNKIINSIDVPVTRYDEPEGITFYDGKITMVGYTRQYLTRRDIYINNNTYNEDINEWRDIKDAFSLVSTQSAASITDLKCRFNWVTRKVRINGTITNVSLTAGVNNLLTITNNVYKPEDYYTTFSASHGNKPATGRITNRTSIGIITSVAEGSATVYLTAEYYANGIYP